MYSQADKKGSYRNPNLTYKAESCSLHQLTAVMNIGWDYNANFTPLVWLSSCQRQKEARSYRVNEFISGTCYTCFHIAKFYQLCLYRDDKAIWRNIGKGRVGWNEAIIITNDNGFSLKEIKCEKTFFAIDSTNISYGFSWILTKYPQR